MRQFNMKRILILTALSVALGACSTLDKIGDGIDEDCRQGAGGTLTVTQKYLDAFNERLTDKGRLFRIDGITCLE